MGTDGHLPRDTDESQMESPVAHLRAAPSSSSDADGRGRVDPVEGTSEMVGSRRAAGHCSGVATARRSAQ